MPRAAGLTSIVLLACLALATTPSCRRGVRDLSSADAAAALRAESGFTSRPGSPVGRELVEILAVRRIGQSSTEVEFTWRDRPSPAGQATAPLKTGMALYRLDGEGHWQLASLYKVQ